MNLLGTFKSLLIESASLADVQKSIKDKTVMTIYYDGDIPGGKGYRKLSPYV